jgi:hypothetical protein
MLAILDTRRAIDKRPSWIESADPEDAGGRGAKEMRVACV